jgi:hypothetical protein
LKIPRHKYFCFRWRSDAAEAFSSPGGRPRFQSDIMKIGFQCRHVALRDDRADITIRTDKNPVT